MPRARFRSFLLSRRLLAASIGLAALGAFAGAAAAGSGYGDEARRRSGDHHQPVAQPPRAGGTKGTPGEVTEGNEFSVATFDPWPSTEPTHFHAVDDPDLNVGSDPDYAEVGACCGGGNTEEVRGLAEFALTGDGGSVATLTFEVHDLMGLFNQPGTDFDVAIEAYVGDGVEALADYGAPAIELVGRFATGGLTLGERLSYDITDAVVGARRMQGDLGVRLRAVSDPLGGAVVFRNFLLERQAQRASLGGLGAVFCPDGSLRGSCTDPLGSGDRFGTSISVSGNTVMIGVPGDDDAGENAGAVFVFERVGGQLLYREKLLLPPQYVAGGLGRSLKVEGGLLVVGAPDPVPEDRKGFDAAVLQAAIFERLSQGWRFKQPIASTVPPAASGFGSSVDVDGNLMVVGAPGANVAVAYQFNNGFPTQIAVVGPPGPKGATLNFGRAVSVADGKVAIAGGTPLTAGLLGVFQQVADNLALLGAMSAPDPASDFGASIALTGSNVFVGAPLASETPDGAGSRTGAVFSFAFDGSMVGRFVPPDPVPNGLFGVAVASSGDRLAVGQPGAPSSQVYVFNAAATQLTQIDRVVQSTADEAGLGTAVAVDGVNLISAAPDTGTIAGVVDTRGVFASNFEGTRVLPDDPFSFGLAVSLAGTGSGTVRSAPAGIDCPGTCGDRFDAASEVTLTAAPGPDAVFAGWSGDCTGLGPCVVSMISARAVVATFESTALPDLVVAEFGRPAPNDGDGVIGQPYFLDPLVRNEGTGPAAGSRVAVYLSLDGDGDVSDDVLVGEETVPPLAPGASAAIDVDFDLPDLGVGSYEFFARFLVDVGDAVIESSEDNLFGSTRTYRALVARGVGGAGPGTVVEPAVAVAPPAR